jgi:hypothetical protein
MLRSLLTNLVVRYWRDDSQQLPALLMGCFNRLLEQASDPGALCPIDRQSIAMYAHRAKATSMNTNNGD